MSTSAFDTTEKITRLLHEYEVLGKSMNELGLQYNLHGTTILYHLRKNKAKIRHLIPHTLNHDYFTQIDTEAKAYFLGFLYADGCIMTHQPMLYMSIGLQAQDAYILHKFKEEIEYTGPITTYTYKRPGSVCQDTHYLRVGSDKLCQDLIKLGCIPRKSLTLEWPKEGVIPDHLFHHFLRGFYDGDGWISVASCDKSTGRSQLTVGVCGPLAFLSKIKEYWTKHAGGSDNKIHGHSKIYKLTYTGNLIGHRICDHLYQDATIYLARKYDKYMIPQSPPLNRWSNRDRQ